MEKDGYMYPVDKSCPQVTEFMKTVTNPMICGVTIGIVVFNFEEKHLQKCARCIDYSLANVEPVYADVDAIEQSLGTGSKIIYYLKDGEMVRPDNNIRNYNGANFVIMNWVPEFKKYADWSGFLTLAECQDKFVQLEKYGEKDYFFIVVER
jgi:hypothetical protein